MLTSEDVKTEKTEEVRRKKSYFFLNLTRASFKPMLSVRCCEFRGAKYVSLV